MRILTNRWLRRSVLTVFANSSLHYHICDELGRVFYCPTAQIFRHLAFSTEWKWAKKRLRCLRCSSSNLSLKQQPGMTRQTFYCFKEARRTPVTRPSGNLEVRPHPNQSIPGLAHLFIHVSASRLLFRHSHDHQSLLQSFFIGYKCTGSPILSLQTRLNPLSLLERPL